MATFKTRLSRVSKKNGRIILANDYDCTVKNPGRQTVQNIRALHHFLCAVKLNFHLLLPLGSKEISKINHAAHSYGLQTIADIKLNDIGNTNGVAAGHLWDMGFDAVIVNPIMGPGSLKALVRSAHRQDRGVISLCHMSAPEARPAYDMGVGTGKRLRLYQLFLDWAISSRVDGIIVGATFPEVIQYCAKKARRRLDIFSPGVGTQGGEPSLALSSGSDYLIVGRTILGARDPKDVSKTLHLQSLGRHPG